MFGSLVYLVGIPIWTKPWTLGAQNILLLDSLLGWLASPLKILRIWAEIVGKGIVWWNPGKKNMTQPHAWKGWKPTCNWGRPSPSLVARVCIGPTSCPRPRVAMRVASFFQFVFSSYRDVFLSQCSYVSIKPDRIYIILFFSDLRTDYIEYNRY